MSNTENETTTIITSTTGKVKKNHGKRKWKKMVSLKYQQEYIYYIEIEPYRALQRTEVGEIFTTKFGSLYLFKELRKSS